MDKLMERAIELALENVAEGGQPFGAVLAKEDKIIAEGVNELHKKHDVSGHAELLAIRRAQEKLAIDQLAGFTMYASGEPCPMCLAAMYFAGITEIYYCETVDEAADGGMDTSKLIYADFAKPNSERLIQKKHMPASEGEKKPMQAWLDKQQAE